MVKLLFFFDTPSFRHKQVYDIAYRCARLIITNELASLSAASAGDVAGGPSAVVAVCVCGGTCIAR